MENWLETPLIVPVVVGAIAVLITIGIWIGKVNSDRKSFKDFIKEVRGKLDTILQFIGPQIATAISPIQLTDLGRKVSEAIEAKEWASELAEQLADEAKGKDAYEIQELARTNCNRDMDMNELRASICRKIAFQHGLKLEQVIDVLGIELRDILLDKAGLSAPD